MGRRWISFEPVTTLAWFAGLIAMNVSDCEPHSWLASMLLPNGGRFPTSPVFEAHGVGTRSPVTDRYFSYQDAPSYDLRFPAPTEAATITAATATALTTRSNRRIPSPFS